MVQFSLRWLGGQIPGLDRSFGMVWKLPAATGSLAKVTAGPDAVTASTIVATNAFYNSSGASPVAIGVAPAIDMTHPVPCPTEPPLQTERSAVKVEGEADVGGSYITTQGTTT